MTSKFPRVLIADDQPDVRSALRLLIEHEGWQVVGECDSLGELGALLEETSPDLLLLDWELPGWAEMAQEAKRAALRRLQVPERGIRVVALSGRPESRREAVASDAQAFISKVDPGDLIAVLTGVAC